LTQMYPNNLMVLELYSTAPPFSQFSSSGLSTEAVGSLDVFVVLSNGSLVPAFTLGGTVSVTGSASISGSSIIGSVSYVFCNFTLTKSEIGPFDVTTFDELLNLLFAEGVIPVINNILADGFPLPSLKGITLENSSVGFGNRYLLVSTDFTYQPRETTTNPVKVPIQLVN